MIKSNAQLWTYLNKDPKLDNEYERLLDKEACSRVTRYGIVYSDTFSYPVRTYCIKSFDTVQSKITIFEKPGSHTLTIECPGDSLKIEDIAGLVKVHFFRPELLEIVYSPRGGSDEGYENALILGLEKGKFCMAMAIRTIDESDVLGEYNLYQVRLRLTGDTLRNCQLAVKVREKRISQADRSKNYDRSRQYILRFDENRKVFYNVVKHQQPVIDLGKIEYYYINNEWDLP